MKKLLLSIVILLSALPFAIAQNYDDAPGDRGAIRVRLSDNSPIKVELDNRMFKPHGTSLLIGDLPKGRHYLRIFEYDEYTRHRSRVIYEGMVKVHKRTITNAVLNLNSGRLEESMDESATGGAPQGGYNGQPNNEMRGNNNENTPPPPPPPPPAKVYPPVPAEYVAITADNISKIEQKVNDKITDTDKLKVLQSSLKKKSFNTDQLGLMMGWLNFEESRLQLAKWAYSHTTDKNNFPNLERSQFSENNNRYDLDSYINSQTPH